MSTHEQLGRNKLSERNCNVVQTQKFFCHPMKIGIFSNSTLQDLGCWISFSTRLKSQSQVKNSMQCQDGECDVVIEQCDMDVVMKQKTFQYLFNMKKLSVCLKSVNQTLTLAYLFYLLKSNPIKLQEKFKSKRPWQLKHRPC